METALPSSAERVPLSTSDAVNERIRRVSDASLEHHRAHPEEIDARIQELDREWDVERALETMSAAVSLTGLVLGLRARRRWLLVPLVVQSFFLQHALQGWCPPLPVLRRLGFRTPNEIERERQALCRIREKDTARPRGVRGPGTLAARVETAAAVEAARRARPGPARVDAQPAGAGAPPRLAAV